jgi:hypothetical protein
MDLLFVLGDVVDREDGAATRVFTRPGISG